MGLLKRGFWPGRGRSGALNKSVFGARNNEQGKNVMSVRSFAVAALAVAGVSASPVLAGDYRDGLVEKDHLVIATTGNAPPMTMVQEDGSLGGFDIALCGRVAEDLGLTPKFVRVDFAATIPGLKAGRFDMICSAVARTPARLASEDIYMSDPTIENYTTLMVRDGAPITTVEAAAGKRIGVVRGGQEAKLLEAVFGKNVTVTTYPGIAEELLDLKNGRVDAVAMNYITASYQAQKDVGLKVIAPGFTLEGVSPYEHGLVVSRKEPDLLTAVNKALGKLATDGQIDALKATWIGGE